jgi:phosphonate transport system substrate-binding protein
MGKALIIICLYVIIISGCSKAETTPPKETKNQDTSILIGLIPERNIFRQIERYEPLADYLSKNSGINIKIKVLTRYGNIIDNFVSLGLDSAFFGSFTYTLAHAKLGVEPIARPERHDGTSTYYGLIFVRKDSGIKTAKDLKGKSFAFVDRATTAGHLLPLAYFKENGIKDYRTYFKETYFTGTHEDAIYDVLNKKADIGAAKNTVYYELSDSDKRIAKELVILKRSPDVPENGLAVRKDLNVSITNKLKETLLNMHNDPDGIHVLKNFGALKFIETTDDDYAAVYKYVKEIGLNLATYDYINE